MPLVIVRRDGRHLLVLGAESWSAGRWVHEDYRGDAEWRALVAQFDADQEKR